MPNEKPKILLHVCCAVCGAALIEILKQKFEPVIFYYNPNIWPKEEYEKRKKSAQDLAKIEGAEFFEGIYENQAWLEKIKGLEKELEGGGRCSVCFKMRLEITASFAKENSIQYFATTLSASPYKNEETINKIGQECAKKFGINFLALKDLDIAPRPPEWAGVPAAEGSLGNKKQLWQKTRQLAKQYNFYHQKYCGCFFSISDN